MDKLNKIKSIQLNCPECNQPFLGRKNQKYCSRSCASKGYRKNDRYKSLICDYCKNEFLRKSSKKNSDGKFACKECKYKFHNKKWKEKQIGYNKTPKARLKSREYMLGVRYNLSLEDYNKLVDDQNGLCAICQQKNLENKYLVVDHDHHTGIIRGLLCDKCNRAIGVFKDSIYTMQNAISYLIGAQKLNSWDRYFMNITAIVSCKSKDPSTKVGALLVRDRHIIATAYNGFPKGIFDSKERLANRELKYKLICHAEENILAQCSLHGVSANNADLYVFPFMPCSNCMRLIITAGIKRIVFPKAPTEALNRWGESFKLSKDMAKEAGLELVEYE